MEWSIAHNPCTGRMDVALDYTDLTGVHQRLVRSVGREDALDGNAYLLYVKKNMKREVTRELGEQAVMIKEQEQARRQDMVGTLGTAVIYGPGPALAAYTTAAYSTTSSTTDIWADGPTYTVTWDQNFATPLHAYPIGSREIEIELPLGKRTIVVKKAPEDNRVKVSLEDVDKAILNCKEQFHFNINVRRAERKAEDLLKSFISEVDFRNYKEKGYFVVKLGDKIYRIHRDKHKFVDMWEQKGEILVPKNRLCSHTETRQIPHADEALSKLLMVRSGMIEKYANFHPIDAEMTKLAQSKELILCN